MDIKNLEILSNIIAGVESGGQIYGNKKYGSYAGAYANSPNEVTVTLGWAQNYGSNARKLIQRIYDLSPETFKALDKAGIEDRLSSDWVASKWNPSEKEKKVLVDLLISDNGKRAQDEFFYESARLYISHAEAYGVTDVPAQMMWAEIEHLGGQTPVKRIFGRAEKPWTTQTILESLQKDKEDMSNDYQVGDKIYDGRHRCCALWISQYAQISSENTIPEKSEIELIYEVERDETGYLEKASNAYLDDKTKNAGYNNITKYWRDTTKEGMMKSYGYSADSGFVGGVNWPYCADGQFWSFMKAVGLKRAQELLLHSGTAFINCETMYNKAKAAKRIIANPKAGALVLFKKSANGEHHHVEFCYAVKDNVVYTIGFNTSGASSVIANGGGVCDKRYKIGTFYADYFLPAYKESGNIEIVVDPGISVTSLKYGAKGDAVGEIQEKLLYLGYDLGKYGADKDFGSCTKKAVIEFQKDHDLTQDGVVGEITAKAINVAYEAKKNASTSKTTDPDKAAVLFVGKVKYDGTDVRTWAGREYGNIKSWPKLNKGNLVKVLDYTQKDSSGEEWYFVQITDDKTYRYKGFVAKKNIEKN